ncbi:uncharacterized protein [Montipora capricornis]|uniref:uncharacterized protein n=1 Tax=Montipora capricornis TaxID=246305 RepID=UPI0035F2111E
MANILCFAVFLFVAQSVAMYVDQTAPQYQYQVIRSAIPRPVPQPMIVDPHLAQLLLARKQAIRIEKDIDSEIKTLVQENAYRRTFEMPRYNLNGLPFFSPKPANTLSAVIGAQGGSWFPGPSGAGIEGSRMLEGRANQLNGRTSQDATQRTDQTKGAWFPDPSGAGIIPQGHANQLGDRRTQVAPQRPFQAVGAWFPYPLGAGIGRVNKLGDRRTQETAQRPVQRGSVPTLSPKGGAVRAKYTQVVHQGQTSEIGTRTFSPATSQITMDPSDEVEKLGNPQEFNEKCMVLKLTFEKSDAKGVALDDSPQKNNGKFEGEAHVLKESEDLGRSAEFENNGKIVLADNFKGKPRKSVAISLWVRLDSVQGTVPLITATGEENFVWYDLLLRDGKGEWVHRGDSGKELFRVQSSSPDVTAGQWHNIVGTYDAVTKSASLWVDGKEVARQDGISGLLSQKWNKLTIFGSKSRGEMDNIFMFRCPLDKTKIVALYVSDASHKDVKKDVIA